MDVSYMHINGGEREWVRCYDFELVNSKRGATFILLLFLLCKAIWTQTQQLWKEFVFGYNIFSDTRFTFLASRTWQLFETLSLAKNVYVCSSRHFYQEIGETSRYQKMKLETTTVNVPIPFIPNNVIWHRKTTRESAMVGKVFLVIISYL
jgi:hypothetical protein